MLVISYEVLIEWFCQMNASRQAADDWLSRIKMFRMLQVSTSIHDENAEFRGEEW